MQLFRTENTALLPHTSSVGPVFLDMVTAEQCRAGQALCRESLKNLKLSTSEGRKAKSTRE